MTDPDRGTPSFDPVKHDPVLSASWPPRSQSLPLGKLGSSLDNMCPRAPLRKPSDAPVELSSSITRLRLPPPPTHPPQFRGGLRARAESEPARPMYRERSPSPGTATTAVEDDGIFALDEENSDDAGGGGVSDNELIFELDGFEDEVDEDGNRTQPSGGYPTNDLNADLFDAETVPEDADLFVPRQRAQTSVVNPDREPPLGVSPVLGSLLQNMAQANASSPRDRAFTSG